jgi:hypothetical protein
MPWVRVAVVGSAAGFASGLFGIGGGVIIVAALVLVAKFPHKLATGTSLAAILPICLSGLAGYATGGEVDWSAAAWVSLGAIPGAIIGTRLLVTIRTPLLQVVFAAAMIVGAIRLLFEDVAGDGRPDMTARMAVAMILVGLASGILAGLLGIGGGIVIVPALTLLFGVPHVLAKGTSLAIVVPTALMGTVRNRQAGLAALRPAAAVGVAGIAAAAVASKVSLGMSPRVSAILFAGLLCVAAVRLARTGIQGLRNGESLPRTEAEVL